VGKKAADRTTDLGGRHSEIALWFADHAFQEADITLAGPA